jgi:hypothetical protein
MVVATMYACVGAEGREEDGVEEGEEGEAGRLAPEGHARSHCPLDKSAQCGLKAVWCTCAGAPPPPWLCELLMCDKEAIVYCIEYVMTNKL